MPNKTLFQRFGVVPALKNQIHRLAVFTSRTVPVRERVQMPIVHLQWWPFLPTKVELNVRSVGSNQFKGLKTFRRDHMVTFTAPDGWATEEYLR